jgi:uncharacterized protein YdiU (UPF0061 family)
MRAKLGLSADADGPVVTALVDGLLDLLRTNRVDYTSFFRSLAQAARGDAAPTRRLFSEPAAADEWLARWTTLEPEAGLMNGVNPAYIPRNHLVEEALAAATDGDLGPLERLLEAVTTPFDERPGLERYTLAAPPDFGTYRTFCGT